MDALVTLSVLKTQKHILSYQAIIATDGTYSFAISIEHTYMQPFWDPVDAHAEKA